MFIKKRDRDFLLHSNNYTDKGLTFALAKFTRRTGALSPKGPHDFVNDIMISPVEIFSSKTQMYLRAWHILRSIRQKASCESIRPILVGKCANYTRTEAKPLVGSLFQFPLEQHYFLQECKITCVFF